MFDFPMEYNVALGLIFLIVCLFRNIRGPNKEKRDKKRRIERDKYYRN